MENLVEVVLRENWEFCFYLFIVVFEFLERSRDLDGGVKWICVYIV